MKGLSIRYFLFIVAFVPASVMAQQDNKAIIKANKLYKEGKFEEAIAEYRKAAGTNPGNGVVQYNLANAIFKKESFDEALITYDKSIELSPDKNFREKNIYNKGVSYTRQKKLPESIAEYKTALKIDPTDEDARHNLQKALHEQRQQNQSNENKPDPQKKQQQQQKKQQPKDQSKFNRKQVEQLMKALRQKEQDIQQKMQQNRTRATSQPDKDW
ncbi:MAG: tetratricopeptide repeat protein [Chitinophagaceae bacterium]|nr:MAG: tetratricopeptide repeat protein [Chitinophagaceae bacterium]